MELSAPRQPTASTEGPPVLAAATPRPRAWRAALAALRRGWGIPLLLCSMAAVLRFRNLDAQSLWLDEGMTVYFINLGLERLWEITFVQEPNPPLYYLLLLGWTQVFGQGEVALRSLSALLGTATVLPIFWLTRSIGETSGSGPEGPPVQTAGLLPAALAGLLATASPFLLWYAQEARAFALLGLLSATLLYLTHGATTAGATARSRAFWAACATLTLYTHIYGAFTVAACALALLGAGSGPVRARVLVVLAPALLYAPWVTALLVQSAAARGWRAPIGPDELVGRTLAAITHFDVLEGGPALAAVALVCGLAALGLITTGRRAAVLLGLASVLPLAAAYGLSFIKPIFAERYLIGIAPALYVAASLGLAACARLAPRLHTANGVSAFRRSAILAGAGRAAALGLRALPPLVVLGALALLAASLSAFASTSSGRFAKENFRAAADLVAARAGPRDLVVFVAEFTQHPFRYYYRGPGRLVGFFGDHRNPGPYLEPRLQDTDLVWLLESHWDRYDPDHQVRRWLQDRYPLVTEAYPQGIHLRAFRVHWELEHTPRPATPVTATFGPLQLLGADFPATTPARDEALHPPSAWLPVTLYWQAREPPGADYRLRVELVDERGVWGRSLDREADLLARVPTSRWRPGPTMVESVDVNLNPATPPGAYALQLAVLGPGGQPLGLVRLGQVVVH